MRTIMEEGLGIKWILKKQKKTNYVKCLMNSGCLNEFRSEGGKNAPSLCICPRLERVSGQQSHISVKEFIPISSLSVYLESTRFTLVSNKSLYSITWPFGEPLSRYFYLKLIFNLDIQWPTPWTLLFLWHQIHCKVWPLQQNTCFINTYFYFHIHFLLTRIANLNTKRQSIIYDI